MSENIDYRIRVLQNQLETSLKENETLAKKLGSALRDNEKSAKSGASAFGGLTSSITDLAKGFTVGTLAANAINSAISFFSNSLKGSIQEAINAENEINNLSFALRRSGDFSKETLNDFLAFSDEIERTTTVSGGASNELLALAKNLGATNDQAKSLALASANLAASLGGDVNSRAEELGKTLSGTGGRLSQLIPEIKSLTEEQLRAGAAFDIVNSKFAGAAQSQLDTYSGRLTQLGNIFNGLQERIGAFVTRSETINGAIGLAVESIDILNKRLDDNAIKTKLSKDGFVETAPELERLSEQYAEITGKISQYQAVIDADKTKGFFESIFSFDNAPLAQEKVRELTIELQRLDSQIAKSAERVAQTQETTQPRAAVDNRTADEIEREKTLNAELLALRNQLALERNRVDEENRILDKERFFARSEEDIESLLSFEQKKSELLYQEALKRNELLRTEEERVAANKKALLDKELRDLKITNDGKGKQRSLELEQQESFFSAATSLANSQNKTLFAIGKAAALADLAMRTPKAVANSYEFGTGFGGPALGAVFGGIALAAMTRQAAQIAGVQGLATGGVVGGFSGATAGPDNTMINARNGEMYLNAPQQKLLFDRINNGTSGDIIVQIDGVEIARAVRAQVKRGFQLA
jgi:hypothetical protein